jgi:tetratricopeptide (TPR) repeat protein
MHLDDQAPYQVARQGLTLGTFPLPELRRRRAAGEFNGTEFVWRQGLAAWLPIDQVLGGMPGRPVLATPPAAPVNAGSGKTWWIVGGGCLTLILLLIGLCVGAFYHFQKKVREAAAEALSSYSDDPVMGVETAPATGLDLATSLPPAPPTALTQAAVAAQSREFFERNFLVPHRAQKGGADELIALWIEIGHGRPTTAQRARFESLAEEMINADEARDTVALVVLADSGLAGSDEYANSLLERGVLAEAISKYPAFTQFYTLARLASEDYEASPRRDRLDERALAQLKRSLQAGELRPEDEPILAEILIDGVAEGVFSRQRAAIVALFAERAAEWRWLSLVLAGEGLTYDAWATRGDGSDDDTTSAGRAGFKDNLGKAAVFFEQAHELHPDRAMAAACMVTVAMGLGEGAEMRRWFEQALAAQIDHDGAWANIGWGLYPRWLGSQEAMLALGVAAVDAGRFDSEQPHKLMMLVRQIEDDDEYSGFYHGRADIWPQVARMYEGYLAEPTQEHNRDYWQTRYGVAAYLNEDYELAAKLFAATSAGPVAAGLRDWGMDLTYAPGEVIMRTGFYVDAVDAAEELADDGETAKAREAYERLLKKVPAGPAREWVEEQLRALE